MFLLLRIFTAILACIGLISAISQMWIDLQVAPVVSLSKRIENGVMPEPGFWSKFEDRSSNSIGVRSNCNNEALRAELFVSLAKLDSLSRGTNLSARDNQRAAAIAEARQVITCAPMDGNAWFRLGILQLGAVGPTPEVLGYFDTADKLTPAEGWLIRIRTPIYADLASRGIKEFRNRAIRDMMVFTAFGHEPPRAFRWLVAWPDLLRDGFMQGMTLVSNKEHKWYLSLATNFDINIGQNSKDSFINDPFTGHPISKNVGN